MSDSDEDYSYDEEEQEDEVVSRKQSEEVKLLVGKGDLRRGKTPRTSLFEGGRHSRVILTVQDRNGQEDADREWIQDLRYIRHPFPNCSSRPAPIFAIHKSNLPSKSNLAQTGPLFPIYEVSRRLKRNLCGSWFWKDIVVSHCGMFILHELDPLFLALPYLTGIGKKGCDYDPDETQGPGEDAMFRTVDETFETAPLWFREWVTRAEQAGLLNALCEREEAGNDFYWKISEGKLMAWLRVKTKRISELIRTHQTHMAPDTAPKSLSEIDSNEHAILFLAPYLHFHWVRELKRDFGIVSSGSLTVKKKSKGVKRKASQEAEDQPEPIRLPQRQVDSDDDKIKSPTKPPAKLSANAKKLAAGAKGSKSLLQMFAKKQ